MVSRCKATRERRVGRIRVGPVGADKQRQAESKARKTEDAKLLAKARIGLKKLILLFSFLTVSVPFL